MFYRVFQIGHAIHIVPSALCYSGDSSCAFGRDQSNCFISFRERVRKFIWQVQNSQIQLFQWHWNHRSPPVRPCPLLQQTQASITTGWRANRDVGSGSVVGFGAHSRFWNRYSSSCLSPFTFPFLWFADLYMNEYWTDPGLAYDILNPCQVICQCFPPSNLFPVCAGQSIIRLGCHAEYLDAQYMLHQFQKGPTP